MIQVNRMRTCGSAGGRKFGEYIKVSNLGNQVKST